MTEFFQEFLRIFGAKVPVPSLYGWFHLVSFALVLGIGILLCAVLPKPSEKQERAVFLTISVIVIVFEIYKQIITTFTLTETGIAAEYPWKYFPFQFCHTPAYVGFLAAFLPKGKMREMIISYLGTFSLFAGFCVLFYPEPEFSEIAGLNIQTFVWHGSMVIQGMWLLGTGRVKTDVKSVLNSIPIFASAISVAMVINEIAFRTGLTERGRVNMFFISPYEEPFLPVYSAIQRAVPYPLCLILYILTFSAGALLVLLPAVGLRHFLHKKKQHQEEKAV